MLHLFLNQFWDKQFNLIMFSTIVCLLSALALKLLNSLYIYTLFENFADSRPSSKVYRGLVYRREIASAITLLSAYWLIHYLVSSSKISISCLASAAQQQKLGCILECSWNLYKLWLGIIKVKKWLPHTLETTSRSTKNNAFFFLLYLRFSTFYLMV